MPLKGQYSYGKIALTNGSKAVVGTGTAWANAISQGDKLTVVGEGVYYDIDVITDDTHLTLKSAYAGQTAAVLPYAIQRDFTQYNGYAIPSYGDQETTALLAQALTLIDSQLAQVLPRLVGVVGGTLQMNGTLEIDAIQADNPIMTLAGSNLTASTPARFAGVKIARVSTASFFVWDENQQGFVAYTSSDDLATPTLGTIIAGTFKGTLVSTSDKRFKTVIGPISGALDLVKKLQGSEYEWNEKGLALGLTPGRKLGLMAQDVLDLLPMAVMKGKVLGIDYLMLIPVIIEALKELASENNGLRNRIAELETSIASLRVV